MYTMHISSTVGRTITVAYFSEFRPVKQSMLSSIMLFLPRDFLRLPPKSHRLPSVSDVNFNDQDLNHHFMLLVDI